MFSYKLYFKNVSWCCFPNKGLDNCFLSFYINIFILGCLYCIIFFFIIIYLFITYVKLYRKPLVADLYIISTIT